MRILSFFLSASFFLLPQSFQLTGTVRDPGGRGIPNIKVSLLDENYQPMQTRFADSSGRFQFRGLRSGRFNVRVETFGTDYEERMETLDLQSISPRAVSETIVLDFVLKLKKGAEPKYSGTLFSQEVPAAARAEYEKGLDNLKKNKPDKAIESFKKVIENFPDFYMALELLGVEYVRQGQFEDALPLLAHALEINDKGERSMYALGVAHLKLNHNRDAIEWLEKAREREPLNVNTHMMLGLAHGNIRQLDQSEVSFKKAYQLGGKDAADAHLYLAGIYNTQKKYSDAVKELETYLKEVKDPKDPAKIKKMIDGLKAKEQTKQ
jgi:tetratricopeptide (TPR) repeat protein